MIKTGQKVRFDPFGFLTGFGALDNRGSLVVGTVVMVNKRHKVFWVEYGNPKQLTSFKFCDLGEEVTICGE